MGKPDWYAVWDVENFGFKSNVGCVLRQRFLLVFEQCTPTDNQHNTRLEFRSRVRKAVADRVTKLGAELAKGTNYCGFATSDPAGKILGLYWEDEIKLI